MDTSTLDKTHKVEREFHDQWARTIDLKDVRVRDSFDSYIALENQIILSHFGNIKGKRLLDLGCGAGEASVYFALQGAQVTSVDISEEMLKKTQQLANTNGVKITTHQMVSEELKFKDDSFDLIYGSNVLHHVDTELTIKEVTRILAKDGRAAFYEPLSYNPFINVYRKIAKDVRTPTEHSFLLRDFRFIHNYFDSVRFEFCWFATLSVFLYMYLIERIDPTQDRYWKRIIREQKRYEKMFKTLNKFDQRFLRLFPFMNRFCWNIVILLKNKKALDP